MRCSARLEKNVYTTSRSKNEEKIRALDRNQRHEEWGRVQAVFLAHSKTLAVRYRCDRDVARHPALA
jgi:hypothetical protein